jgi:phosphatidylinositol-3-phosphatase
MDGRSPSAAFSSTSRVVALLGVVFACLLALTRPALADAPGLTAAANSFCGSSAAPPAAFQHVIWIVFENKPYDSVIGSTSAPYINSLANDCGLATNFTAETHPSLPNYIAMTSGSTQGITDDSGPASHPLDVPNIFNQLGSDWRALQESMPSNCAKSNSGTYAVRHNPAAYYTNIDCAAGDVPLGSTPDLSAKFTFVTPNLCNDMHDCSVQTGDSWLSTFMPQVFASPEYQDGGTVVFVTWDEGSGDDQHIATLAISPYTGGGTQAIDPYDHYSLLRTTEELLGLDTLGKATDASSMRSVFNLDRRDRLWMPLVLAYRRCAAANSTHGVPLASPSCSPPSQTTGHLTVGSLDANHQAANSINHVQLVAAPGTLSTPADEGDMGITTSLTDVRLSSDLTDYTGEVQTVLNVRLTDLATTSSGDDPQTVQDLPFRATVPCAATTDTTVGSTCLLATTFDTLVPGSVKEGMQSIWELSPVQVYDGGSDGDGDTTGDNTLFMNEGIFVP